MPISDVNAGGTEPDPPERDPDEAVE